jgi:hypothetical protein
MREPYDIKDVRDPQNGCNVASPNMQARFSAAAVMVAPISGDCLRWTLLQAKKDLIRSFIWI